jgi:hypothetical protein
VIFGVFTPFPVACEDLLMTTAPLTRRGELADLRAVVGRLDLECTVVTTPQCRQRLLNLRPVPGTDTEQRLAALINLVQG